MLMLCPTHPHKQIGVVSTLIVEALPGRAGCFDSLVRRAPAETCVKVEGAEFAVPQIILISLLINFDCLGLTRQIIS